MSRCSLIVGHCRWPYSSKVDRIVDHLYVLNLLTKADKWVEGEVGEGDGEITSSIERDELEHNV